MDFNPNKPAKTKKFFWATYIPYRNPEFKMHSQRGHALSAFQYKSDVILYQWDQTKEEWVEVYRIEKISTDTRAQNVLYCEKCGDEIPRNTWGGRHAYRGWWPCEPNEHGFDREYLQVCSACDKIRPR